ncbi:MAG: Sir2 family NAD-dependent protein deacetylase [Dermatophilaceae bacterium]
MPDEAVGPAVAQPVTRPSTVATWANRAPHLEARMPEATARLGRVLYAHSGTLVLTGAGMSTDSGIPAYRDHDGVRWVTPMQHAEFVGSRANRRRYWARSFVGWHRFSRAEPNLGHRAVAELQRCGAVGAVITQNVDGLHQMAGTERVTDLHGTLAAVVCLECGHRSPRGLLQQRLADANPGFASDVGIVAPDGSRASSHPRPDGDIVIPDAVAADFELVACGECGADMLKPDVVFFGGSVPRERVAACAALVDAAPALLVLGSSLAVMSGLRFVRQASRRGIPVLVVTRGPSRGDDLVTERVDGLLVPVLSALLRMRATG